MRQEPVTNEKRLSNRKAEEAFESV